MRRKRIKLIKRTEAEEVERHRVNRYKCKRCLMIFPDDETLQAHRQYQHGEFTVNDAIRDRRNYNSKASWRDPPKEDWIVRLGNNVYVWNPIKKEYFIEKEPLLKPLIMFPERLYVFEEGAKPTTKIDLNKITKRLVYGDDAFGKPERPNQYTFPGVSASYNGRWINGAISEWSNGWLQKKLELWKISNNPRDKQLLEEYNHPDTYATLPSPLDYCLKYFYLEGIYETKAILLELLGEVLYQKFGVDIVMKVDTLGENKNAMSKMQRRNV